MRAARKEKHEVNPLAISRYTSASRLVPAFIATASSPALDDRDRLYHDHRLV